MLNLCGQITILTKCAKHLESIFKTKNDLWIINFGTLKERTLLADATIMRTSLFIRKGQTGINTIVLNTFSSTLERRTELIELRALYFHCLGGGESHIFIKGFFLFHSNCNEKV